LFRHSRSSIRARIDGCGGLFVAAEDVDRRLLIFVFNGELTVIPTYTQSAVVPAEDSLSELAAGFDEENDRPVHGKTL
jgi:hypothetical protein